MRCHWITGFILAASLCFGLAATPASSPYPGTIQLAVDATDIQHRIFNITERIPVKPGQMKLWFPKWIPGTHSPTGPIHQIAGLIIKGNGRNIDWKRDTLDMNTFVIDVPNGVSMIELEFQSITPVSGTGRIVMTPNMFNLQWNVAALYPADYAANQVQVQASLTLPKDWKPFCGLELDSQKRSTYRYKAIDFENLVDSPVFAGRYYKTFDLDPNPKSPVRLNVVADDPRFLEVKGDQLKAHEELVKQADKLFDSRHFDRYDFLLSLSEQMSGIGLEHHRSSENGVKTNYFTEWDPKIGVYELLAHEYTHSWNGKFRRPADLRTLNYNDPMQNTLLWVYEGQTNYWGHVLNARAGLYSPESARDNLAMRAASYVEDRSGLSWRSLQDTTNEPIIGYRAAKSYPGRQLGVEYYVGGQLIWLEADALIRSKSGGKKSLDDFAKAFFGIDNGVWTPKTYTFDDVVNTLNGVVTDDWAKFLRDRLDSKHSLIEGVEASGWKLVFKDVPNAYQKSTAKEAGGADYRYSIGLNVDKEDNIADVRWDGPAFRAGIATGMKLLAVNDRQYKKDYLDDAIKNAAKSGVAIRLMLKDFDVYRTIEVKYKGGLRYPHLERIEGKPDLLTAIFSAK